MQTCIPHLVPASLNRHPLHPGTPHPQPGWLGPSLFTDSEQFVAITTLSPTQSGEIPAGCSLILLWGLQSLGRGRRGEGPVLFLLGGGGHSPRRPRPEPQASASSHQFVLSRHKETRGTTQEWKVDMGIPRPWGTAPHLSHTAALPEGGASPGPVLPVTSPGPRVARPNPLPHQQARPQGPGAGSVEEQAFCVSAGPQARGEVRLGAAGKSGPEDTPQMPATGRVRSVPTLTVPGACEEPVASAPHLSHAKRSPSSREKSCPRSCVLSLLPAGTSLLLFFANRNGHVETLSPASVLSGWPCHVNVKMKRERGASGLGPTCGEPRAAAGRWEAGPR